MTKKNGKRKRSMTKTVDRIVKTTFVMFPEIIVASRTLADGNWSAFPDRWIEQRTGISPKYGVGDWTVARLTESYVYPLIGLGLYKLGKRIGNSL